ncbi:MAG TPA: right-handed parallel beta-helix repeat-containing protein [Solirubrobacterales bacterium]|nr:right-handed parallel beta-helix repeat-containing protein [Solirubrobacterales bacterium]
MRFRRPVQSIVLILLALLICAATASAETYTVTRADDPIPGACEPGDCSLREAVTASNNSEAVDDVIVIPASASPYVTNYEELALPVNDEVTIRGAGANVVAIEGDAKNGLILIAPGRAVTIEGVTIRNSNGAIQNGGDLTLRGVSIEHNEREAAGGGIQTNGPLRIESSYLGFNGTNGNSGGAIQANGDVTIVNSTVVGNFSLGNSAVTGNDAVTVASSAFVDNVSNGAEGTALGGAPLSVRNSVFARNRNTTGPRNCFSFDPIQSGGNVSDDASCGAGPTDKPNVDPLLGTLAVRGTTPVYDLLAGSPAIDAATGDCPPFDQRGVARPQGSACDSGPYEVEQAPRLDAPADSEVAIRLGKGRLVLSKRGFIRVKLTCLPTEVSPPCSGRLKLLPPRPKKKGAATALAPLAGKRFSLGAGKTKTLALRIRRARADLLRSDPKLRVTAVDLWAQDAAGNVRMILKPRRIFLPKRG